MSFNNEYCSICKRNSYNQDDYLIEGKTTTYSEKVTYFNRHNNFIFKDIYIIWSIENMLIITT